MLDIKQNVQLQLCLKYDRKSSFMFHIFTQAWIELFNYPVFITPVCPDKPSKHYITKGKILKRREEENHYMLLFYSMSSLKLNENVFFLRRDAFNKYFNEDKSFSATLDKLKNDFQTGTFFKTNQKRFLSRDEKELFEKIKEFCEKKMPHLNSSLEKKAYLFHRKKFREKTFFLEGKKYEVVAPVFNSKEIRDTDYLQIRDLERSNHYLLKSSSCFQRGLRQKYPYIQTQYLGSLFAKEFGFKTQESKICEIENGQYLFVKDIRGENSLKIKAMEPIIFYDSKLMPEERNLVKLVKSISKVTSKDSSSFLVELALFDLLIGNNQRDGRSLRIITYDNESRSFDFLIENNLGSKVFVSENTFYTPTLSDIKELIVYFKRESTLKKFYEKLILIDYKGIIFSEDSVSQELKYDAVTVLEQGIQEIKQLKMELERTHA